MKPAAVRPHVILRHCEHYDTERLYTILLEGMRTLALRPFGRTLIKPNLVAAGKEFPHAYTRPEFAEAVVRATQQRARETGSVLDELAVGERCGITIPTRLVFAEAGYDAMLARYPEVKRYCFEEVPQVEIRYGHKARLRDYVFTPEPVAKADCFINLPKFKAHPWTTVTFSIKNYIGIQDDRHRLIDHDHRLNEKIADLQYILQPQFIAIDGITAGEGRMLTPKPFPLKLVLMGNNQVAIDTVASAILGLDPRTIDHIRLTAERGFGTMNLDEITLSGDVTLEAARTRAQGFEVGLIRVEKYFEGTRIHAYAGPPPETEHTDYCWGGCPGAIEEAIEILRQFDRETDAKLPKLHVVFGAYQGAIPAGPGETVVFIGDCAQWEGTLRGELVQIRSRYKDRASKDPHHAKHDDIFAKMLEVSKRSVGAKGKVLRMEGCPVSVAEQVLALVYLGGLKNPFLAPENLLRFNKAYLSWRGNGLLQRLKGVQYQRAGHCPRGEAAPELPVEERTKT